VIAGGREVNSGEVSFTKARTVREGRRFAFSGATRISSARGSGLGGGETKTTRKAFSRES